MKPDLIKKLIIIGVIILLIILAGYLSFQGFLYYRSRDNMPPGMTVAGFGDTAFFDFIASRVLRGNQTQIGHELCRVIEAG